MPFESLQHPKAQSYRLHLLMRQCVGCKCYIMSQCSRCAMLDARVPPQLASSLCSRLGAGMFAADDWTCPGCGNVNWARRSSCNKCNTAKPGTVDTNREGHGGGFKVSFTCCCCATA